MKWYIADENGLIRQCGNRGPLPEGAVEVETDFSIGTLSEARIVNGVPVLRATGPDIVEIGTTCTVVQAPAGTVIEIYDAIGEEKCSTVNVTELDDIEINFDVPGTYVIEVEPPLPMLPVNYRVTV